MKFFLFSLCVALFANSCQAVNKSEISKRHGYDIGHLGHSGSGILTGLGAGYRSPTVDFTGGRGHGGSFSAGTVDVTHSGGTAALNTGFSDPLAGASSGGVHADVLGSVDSGFSDIRQRGSIGPAVGISVANINKIPGAVRDVSVPSFASAPSSGYLIPTGNIAVSVGHSGSGNRIVVRGHGSAGGSQIIAESSPANGYLPSSGKIATGGALEGSVGVGNILVGRGHEGPLQLDEIRGGSDGLILDDIYIGSVSNKPYYGGHLGDSTGIAANNYEHGLGASSGKHNSTPLGHNGLLGVGHSGSNLRHSASNVNGVENDYQVIPGTGGFVSSEPIPIGGSGFGLGPVVTGGFGNTGYSTSDSGSSLTSGHTESGLSGHSGNYGNSFFVFSNKSNSLRGIGGSTVTGFGGSVNVGHGGNSGRNTFVSPGHRGTETLRPRGSIIVEHSGSIGKGVSSRKFISSGTQTGALTFGENYGGSGAVGHTISLGTGHISSVSTGNNVLIGGGHRGSGGIGFGGSAGRVYGGSTSTVQVGADHSGAVGLGHATPDSITYEGSTAEGFGNYIVGGSQRVIGGAHGSSIDIGHGRTISHRQFSSLGNRIANTGKASNGLIVGKSTGNVGFSHSISHPNVAKSTVRLSFGNAALAHGGSFGGSGHAVSYGGSGQIGESFGGSGHAVSHEGSGHIQSFGGSGHTVFQRGSGQIESFGGSGHTVSHGGGGQIGFFGGSGQVVSQGGSGQIGSFGGSGHIGSFGGNGQAVSQGGSGQIGSFGGSGHIGSFGGSGQAVSHGGSGQVESFGGSGQIGSFGGSGQAVSHGGSGQVGSFGGSGQIGSFGGSGQAVFHGGSGQIRFFGGSGQAVSHGSSGQRGSFGGSGQAVSHGGSGQIGYLGSSGQAVSHEGSGQIGSFGGSGQAVSHEGSGQVGSFGGSGQAVPHEGSGQVRSFGGSGQAVSNGGSGQIRFFAGSGHIGSFGGSGQIDSFGGSGRTGSFGGSGQAVSHGGSGQRSSFGGSGQAVSHGGSGQRGSFGGSGQAVSHGGSGHIESLWR